ncbi:MAG: bifunctional (p)ppGpp synthetase/guanosine-3',5'-bis(diphosphate) 3'-pyrophosphohydrolase [Pseudomonadota bacterium]
MIERVQSYNRQSDVDAIRAAYDYALTAHEGQYRRSGEPYIVHPVAVTSLLAEQHLDDATLITALLHDTVEDTKATADDITAKFGSEIAGLVDGVTKLTNFQIDNTETKQAENFRKLFLAMSKDLRVVLVKLFDRLHNMRTLRSLPTEKQVHKARETMDIYAPLAGRMGMQWMRDELEDLSFQVLNPDARRSIMRRMVQLRGAARNEVENIRYDIAAEMMNENIPCTVHGRVKRPYSIWRKMGQSDSDEKFQRISDLYGFRLIVDTQMDCYRALGVIHRRWRAVPGRFKDYVSEPKVNGYRSLHTTVLGRDGKRIEVQVRTRQMHEVAEKGVAAHWAYRNGERIENDYMVDPREWVSGLTDLDPTTDVSDFFETVKLEMYADKVFCFTPKGAVIKLPKGATPIDFAFAIHTRIGLACVGARVDGHRVPLWTKLRNGQAVEIITAEAQRPEATWVDIAVTGKAKSAIRRALREEQRSRFIKLGRELVRTGFAQIDKQTNDKALEAAARHLGFGTDIDELLAKMGSGEITARDVATAVYPELAESEGDEVDVGRAVLGLYDGQSWQRSPCCQPVPGERIVGIQMPGIGVAVHAIDCASLENFETQMDRWVDLHWQPGRHSAAFGVSLGLAMGNDAGVLGRVCTLIGEQQANISDVELLDRKPDFFRARIEVEVRNIEQLHRVLTALEAEPNVTEVTRHRDVVATP